MLKSEQAYFKMYKLAQKYANSVEYVKNEQISTGRNKFAEMSEFAQMSKLVQNERIGTNERVGLKYAIQL